MGSALCEAEAEPGSWRSSPLDFASFSVCLLSVQRVLRRSHRPEAFTLKQVFETNKQQMSGSASDTTPDARIS